MALDERAIVLLLLLTSVGSGERLGTHGACGLAVSDSV